MLRKLIALLFAIPSLLLMSAAKADFPDKPIKILVPFPAGSGTDGAARVMSNEITNITHQSVVIENKPGANGFIATEQVAKATPDGYTLLMTSNTHLVNKFLFKKLPYDPIGDFKSVALYKKTTPLVMVVAMNAPYKTLADITAAAKKEAGRLSYASGNSSSRVGAELYKQLTGIDLLYVPFKGNPEALSEVAAGRVDMMFSDVVACMPLLHANKLRAVVVTGTERLPLLPDTPSSPEAGQPGLEIGSWGMLLAPRGTPDAVLDKLNALMNEVAKKPSVEKFFTSTNAVAYAGTRHELDQYMESETKKWGGIIKKANIQPE